ncbi:MAG: hypothetical protein NVS3B18_07640 [Candidatus Dormibacteria bacterium]
MAAPHQTAAAQRDAPAAELDELGTTPILREYRAVQAEFPDAIVLARLGDFFELFGADAELAAPLLGLTLTGRGFGNAGRVPMCGVPQHAATGYIRRLLEAGHRVCVWDQVETAETAGRGLVRREVTRVLSPGAVVDDGLLEPGSVARCAALLPLPGRVGVAVLDASTGDLQLGELAGGLDSPALAEELEQLDKVVSQSEPGTVGPGQQSTGGALGSAELLGAKAPQRDGPGAREAPLAAARAVDALHR